jgi:hypothetical protein
MEVAQYRIAKPMIDDHEGNGGDEKDDGQEQKDDEDTKVKWRHGEVSKPGCR